MFFCTITILKTWRGGSLVVSIMIYTYIISSLSLHIWSLSKWDIQIDLSPAWSESTEQCRCATLTHASGALGDMGSSASRYKSFHSNFTKRGSGISGLNELKIVFDWSNYPSYVIMWNTCSIFSLWGASI